ncbi:hypothetical protein BD779DRAFT_817099 [Infundibulicybe gibba]|nr:hypothetical protein BD779DRAFT_817099 [Infundibulicybe gibba]
MMTSRHSARTRSQPPRYAEISSYPDGPANGPYEHAIKKLNSQSFGAEMYARVDDILVYSVFASKTRPRGYRALKPRKAFSDIEDQESLPCTPSQSIGICKIYNEVSHMDKTANTTWASARSKILAAYPELFDDKDAPILDQDMAYCIPVTVVPELRKSLTVHQFLLA